MEYSVCQLYDKVFAFFSFICHKGDIVFSFFVFGFCHYVDTGIGYYFVTKLSINEAGRGSAKLSFLSSYCREGGSVFIPFLSVRCRNEPKVNGTMLSPRCRDGGYCSSIIPDYGWSFCQQDVACRLLPGGRREEEALFFLFL